jgi:hypothetical protein
MTAVAGAREDTLKAGLLMESAQAHQALAAENLQRLQAHIRELDAVVRDEIRRTLLEELQAVNTESRLAVQAMSRARHFANRRLAILGSGLVMFATAIPAGIFAWLVPSSTQINALRAQRADLEAALLRLREQGALIELRYCGDQRRLCVRIDRNAPTFGEQADYWIAKGY